MICGIVVLLAAVIFSANQFLKAKTRQVILVDQHEFLFGSARNQIRNEFGEPDDISVEPKYGVEKWKYHNLSIGGRPATAILYFSLTSNRLVRFDAAIPVESEVAAGEVRDAEERILDEQFNAIQRWVVKEEIPDGTSFIVGKTVYYLAYGLVLSETISFSSLYDQADQEGWYVDISVFYNNGR